MSKPAFYVCLAIGITLLLTASGCADDASSSTESSCIESRLSAGTAYRFDPGTAIALSRAIAHSDPELEGIVDAAAERQERNPASEVMTVDSESRSGEVSLTYLLAIVNLSTHAELADTTMDTVEQAALGTEDGSPRLGGIGGVYNLLTDPDRLNDLDDSDVFELARLVDEQVHAVEDAGILPLPTPGCTNTPGSPGSNES